MDIPFCIESFISSSEQKGTITLKSNLPKKIKPSSYLPSCGGFKYSDGEKTRSRYIVWYENIKNFES